MVAQREAKAEEERLRKKAVADAAMKAVVEQTEKQNNEEDELRMLRWARRSDSLLPFVPTAKRLSWCALSPRYKLYLPIDGLCGGLSKAMQHRMDEL